jgi:hypothetical protein
LGEIRADHEKEVINLDYFNSGIKRSEHNFLDRRSTQIYGCAFGDGFDALAIPWPIQSISVKIARLPAGSGRAMSVCG